MTDTLPTPTPADATNTNPPTTGPVTIPGTTNTTPGDPAGQTATTPAADPATTTDYRALYEATLAKLGQAETLAQQHQDKVKRLDEIEAANQTEAERAAARAEAAEKQVADLRHRAVDAEIRAAATGWAEPTDAPLYLPDRKQYVNERGEIDTAAIARDLAAVVTARPYLVRVDGPRRPAPDPSQGARQTGPSGLEEQIREAETKGDWLTAISLKNQRLAEQARQQR